jgi:hypothetical protein
MEIQMIKAVSKKIYSKGGARKLADRYPILCAALAAIEQTTHQLELSDGRYGYLKYLQSVYTFYLKSRDRKTLKRDRRRICLALSLKERKDLDLISVLIKATSNVSKSSQGKYASLLRLAETRDVRPEDVIAFGKGRKKKVTRSNTQRPRLPPRLHVIRSSVN